MIDFGLEEFVDSMVQNVELENKAVLSVGGMCAELLICIALKVGGRRRFIESQMSGSFAINRFIT